MDSPKEERYFEQRGTVEAYTERTIDTACPVLRKFLRPGLGVLDVGCGPGTITAAVGSLVAPGEVVGVDTANTALEQARAYLAKGTSTNVTVQQGNAYALPFRDKHFDLSYSNGVFEWLENPVRAIKEQMRVVKSGGQIVVLTASTGDRRFYPPCPALQDIQLAVGASAPLIPPTETLSSASRSIFDSHRSEKTYGILRRAGLENIEVEIFHSPIEVAYPGSTYFDYKYRYMIELFLGDYHNRPWCQKLVSEGRLTWAIFDKAREEIELWHNDPDALVLNPRVCCTGRVP